MPTRLIIEWQMQSRKRKDQFYPYVGESKILWTGFMNVIREKSLLSLMKPYQVVWGSLGVFFCYIYSVYSRIRAHKAFFLSLSEGWFWNFKTLQRWFLKSKIWWLLFEKPTRHSRLLFGIYRFQKCNVKII